MMGIKERIEKYFEKNKSKRYFYGLIAVMLTWGAYFIYLWPKMLYWDKNGGITAGWVNIWGDWSVHYAFAQVFAYRPIDFWLIHPLTLNHKFNYPFGADAVSGLLIRMGIDKVAAFIIPSIITTIFLLIFMYVFLSLILKSPKQVFVAITLFLASGGLGFIDFLQDLNEHPSLEKLIFPPKQYTQIQNEKIGWWFSNVVTSILLPQRAFLLGMTAVLLMLIILLNWQKEKIENTTYTKLGILGALSSLMLIIHVHSYMVFVFISATLFISEIISQPKNWKKAAVFAGAAAVPSLIIYMTLYTGLPENYMKWQPGVYATENNINIIYFWWVVWGLFIPFSILAIWRTKYYKNPVVIGGIIAFILGNLIAFQPILWDNSKLFFWSYFLFTIPVIAYLSKIWEKNKLMKIIAVLIFISFTFSGFIDLWRLTNTEKLSHQLWSKEELELADKFREISDYKDVVLAATEVPNHWASTNTGRQVLMSYEGWMLNYGIDYNQIQKDMKKMFLGGTESESLMKKYNIKYFVIGPSELRKWNANEKYFKEKYKKALESKNYRIYEID